MSNNRTRFTYAMLAFFVAIGTTVAKADSKPNIVLILIDDLGWRDLGCYGSSYYKTPNIDRLADEGVRFTDAYAACNVCSPSRAAILTGKAPARLLLTQWLPAGRWDRAKNRKIEGRFLRHLPLEEITLAEVLRNSGYRTGFIGKWHLGTEPYYYPRHHGFDVNIAGRDYGAPGSYWYPFEGRWKIPTTDQWLQKHSMLPGEEGDYLVDRLAEEAERFIRDSAGRPFFLFLSHYAVHAPLQGKPALAAKYREIAKPDRQGPPDYAAMIESIDQSVGRVINALSELELTENTLVVFTSDNGGFAKATDNSPLRANKGSNYEGGLRVPMIVRWPNRIPGGNICSEPVIGMDVYPTVLQATGLKQMPNQHVDGRNLLSVMCDGGSIDRDALYWHYPHYNQHPQSFPSGVIRKGRWKLIESYETGALGLYDLQADLGETKNLAVEKSEVANRLLKQLTHWREEVGADMMKDNPDFQPKNE